MPTVYATLPRGVIFRCAGDEMDDVQAQAVDTVEQPNSAADETIDEEPFTVVAAPNALDTGAFSGTTPKARRKHLDDILKPLVVRVGNISERDLRASENDDPTPCFVFYVASVEHRDILIGGSFVLGDNDASQTTPVFMSLTDDLKSLNASYSIEIISLSVHTTVAQVTAACIVHGDVVNVALRKNAMRTMAIATVTFASKEPVTRLLF
ncbi:hypothetical protein BGZ94_003866 [Podila epigama]|nr:hypothetical protein BGZ94_003866 [Podila epigama]